MTMIIDNLDLEAMKLSASYIAPSQVREEEQ